MLYRPVGSIADTSSAFLWVRELPQIDPSPVGILIPIEYMVPWAHLSKLAKWHLNLFSRFFAGLIHVTTHRQTMMLHVTFVAIGRIYSIRD